MRERSSSDGRREPREPRDWPEPGWEAADDAPSQRLSADEARALRARLPKVSPWRVVAAQAMAGVSCAALAWLLRPEAAWSALYGAAATVLPSALLAHGMGKRAVNPMAAAAGFMLWETVKVGVALAMLAMAASVVPRLSWPALLVTMLVCMKVNWFALLWRGRANG